MSAFIRRIWFSIYKSIGHRKQLHQALRSGVRGLALLDEDYFQEVGVKCVILDFDGVLASHGEPIPEPSAVAWLNSLVGFESIQKIYILSNKPNLVRENYFNQHYPAISFIKNVRKKPYPDGINQVVTDSKIDANGCIIIDDRLLTGILAAIIAGIKYVYISKAVTNFSKRPARELGFLLLRTFEKAIFRILH